MIFEAAVVLLAVLWAVSVWAFMRHVKQQREALAQRNVLDALREQRIKELAKRLDAYQNGTVRMGEALHELRATVASLPERLEQLEQRDPHSVTYAQAAKLVGMGASVQELTQSCGLTLAEAELMRKLHGEA